MNPLRLKATVGPDRRLIVDLPADTPLGEAELVVYIPTPPKTDIETYEELHDHLLSIGALVTDFEEIDLTEYDPSILPITLPSDAPTTLEIINMDRGDKW